MPMYRLLIIVLYIYLQSSRRLRRFSQKSWVIFDDQLTFKYPHCKDCSVCRFALHNIRKDQALPLHSTLHNFLSRPWSFLGLRCSSGWTSVKHNQTSTDDSECSGTDWSSTSPKAHVTPLFISLHWLPVAARIQFKTLMLAYRTTTGSAPPTSTHWWQSTSPPEAPPTSTHWWQSTSPPEAPPTSTHWWQSTSPPEAWDLRVSVASWCITERHNITFQNVFIHRSWLVEWTSHPIQNAESLTIFKRHLKTHLFRHHLTSSKNSIQKFSLSFLNLSLSG